MNFLEKVKYTKKHRKWLIRDLMNLIQYGKHAPASCELIFIDPSKITKVLHVPLTRKYSGKVLDGNWDLNTSSLSSFKKYQICILRYVENKSWIETGAYDLVREIIKREPGMDGCHNDEDIIKRYEHLDEVFNWIKTHNRMRTQRELNSKNFREKEGIYIHIGRNGELIFGSGGCHRLSIAKILQLPEIPARLGVVHKDAIKIWGNYVRRTSSPFSYLPESLELHTKKPSYEGLIN